MVVPRRRNGKLVRGPTGKIAVCAQSVCNATCGTMVVSDDPPGWFQCRDYTPIPFYGVSGSGDACIFTFKTHWPNPVDCEDDVVLVELGYNAGAWTLNLFMVHAGDPYDCDLYGAEIYNCSGLTYKTGEISVVGGCLTGALVFDTWYEGYGWSGDELTLTLN